MSQSSFINRDKAINFHMGSPCKTGGIAGILFRRNIAAEIGNFDQQPALAGLITAMLIMRSNVFNRATACVGIIANALDLAYCIAFVLLQAVDKKLLSIYFLSAAGLFLMAWHIMAGWKLYRLENPKKKEIYL